MRKASTPSVHQLEDRLTPAPVAVVVSDLPREPDQLVAAGGKLFFSAETKTAPAGADRELWVSNGTADGTKRLKDIAPGNVSSMPKLGANRFFPTLVAAGSKAYFLATRDRDFRNSRLWVSDGTTDGTTEVGLADPKINYSNPDRKLIAIGETVYFLARNTTTRVWGLWKADGGKVSLVKDLPTAQNLLNLAAHPNGTLFFVLGTAGDNELWHSDGTAAGTKKVTGLALTGGGLFITQLFAAGGTVYFSSNAEAPTANGMELWKVVPDGPGAYKAVQVKDIVSGAGDSQPANMVSFQDKVFFSAATGSNGTDREPWLTNGTAAGTSRLKDLFSGADSGIPDFNSLVSIRTAELNGRLYFRGQNADKGLEVASTNGTADGTAVVTDVAPGATGSDPHWLTTFGDWVYFSAQNRGLWRTDGATTEEVKTDGGATVPSPKELIEVRNDLFMFATDDKVWTLSFPADPPGQQVGGRVWEDTNGNGIREGGELPVSGAWVTLLAADGTPAGWTTTGTDGTYLFADVPAGTYAVAFEQPDGYQFAPQNQTDDDFDSDPDPNSGVTAQFLVSGADVLNQDAGLVPLGYGSLGDFVWNDLDGDGIQDAGEPGVPGVPVALYDSSGQVVESGYTDDSGWYSFVFISPGTYTIGFGLPTTFRFAPTNAGPDAEDSDADPTTGQSPSIPLGLGEHRTDIDAGLVPVSAEVGDYVWDDVNADGVQDWDEPGFGGVTVNLLDGNGNLVASAVTDGSGWYSFAGLGAGTYSVQFIAPPNSQFSPKGQGGNPNLDSDANPSGQTDLFSLADGQVRTDIDAGLFATGSGSGSGSSDSATPYVWNEADGGSIPLASEPGSSSTSANLLDGLGNWRPATAHDASGPPAEGVDGSEQGPEELGVTVFLPPAPPSRPEALADPAAAGAAVQTQQRSADGPLPSVAWTAAFGDGLFLGSPGHRGRDPLEGDPGLAGLDALSAGLTEEGINRDWFVRLA